MGSTPRLWEGLGCAGGVMPGVGTRERSRGEGWEGTIRDEPTHGSCCFVICQLEAAASSVPALPLVAAPHQPPVWGPNCPGPAALADVAVGTITLLRCHLLSKKPVVMAHLHSHIPQLLVQTRAAVWPGDAGPHSRVVKHRAGGAAPAPPTGTRTRIIKTEPNICKVMISHSRLRGCGAGWRPVGGRRGGAARAGNPGGGGGWRPSGSGRRRRAGRG